MTAAVPRAALAAVSILILTLTLTPAEGSGSVTLAVHLLAFRGVADSVSNILLFVPFGACAALVMRGRTAPIAAAFALSLFIETVQLAVPGRFVSSSDILFNTVGAAAGMGLVRSARLWIDPRRGVRRLLAAAALALAPGLLDAGGTLLVPAIPAVRLYGQWTPSFDNMGRYEGEVLAAGVGRLDVPSRLIEASDSLRAYLLRGEQLRLRVVTGPPPPSLAPIFNVYDEYEREMMLVGAAGSDLVVRYRLRATAVRLDQPEIRIRDALANIDAGARLAIGVRRDARGYCVSVRSRERCGLGFTLADTWALLLYPVPRPVAAALRVAWVGVLLLPAGFWLREPRGVATALALVAGALYVAPGIIGILDTGAGAYLSALTGLLAGHFLGRLAGSSAQRLRSDRSDRTPDRIPLRPGRTGP